MGKTKREQRYVPPQILPSPVTTMSARQCDALYRGVWRSRRAVLCRAMPCGQAGGSCGPRQLAVRGCPVQFARLIAQKCSEATSVDEGKLGSSIVFILAPPRCVSSLILAVV